MYVKRNYTHEKRPRYMKRDLEKRLMKEGKQLHAKSLLHMYEMRPICI